MANQIAHSPFAGDVLHTQITELIGLTLRYPVNNQQNPVEQCPLLAFAGKQGGQNAQNRSNSRLVNLL
jgi:hypothetical protein